MNLYTVYGTSFRIPDNSVMMHGEKGLIEALNAMAAKHYDTWVYSGKYKNSRTEEWIRIVIRNRIAPGSTCEFADVVLYAHYTKKNDHVYLKLDHTDVAQIYEGYVDINDGYSEVMKKLDDYLGAGLDAFENNRRIQKHNELVTAELNAAEALGVIEDTFTKYGFDHKTRHEADDTSVTDYGIVQLPDERYMNLSVLCRADRLMLDFTNVNTPFHSAARYLAKQSAPYYFRTADDLAKFLDRTCACAKAMLDAAANVKDDFKLMTDEEICS